MEQVISTFNAGVGSHRSHSTRTIYKDVVDENARETACLNISLNPNSVAACLAGVAGLLVVASAGLLMADHFTGHTSLILHKLVKLFDLDLEVNVPTFFSVLLLFSASALLAFITHFRFRQKAAHVVAWGVLSLGFLFMAFDEMASVHERLIEPMRAILGIDNLGLLYYAWVVPAFVLVGFLGIAYLKFVIDLPNKTRLYFILAASMFLGGSVGLELFEGIYGTETLMYNIFVTCEESLEMGGVIVFIWALLRYIGDNSVNRMINVNVEGGTPKMGKDSAINELGLQS